MKKRNAKLDKTHATIVDILSSNNISISTETFAYGTAIILTDNETGDNFDWHQGPISKGGK
ncbi:hypothetical protein D3C75_158690 [compost metagenome]